MEAAEALSAVISSSDAAPMDSSTRARVARQQCLRWSPRARVARTVLAAGGRRALNAPRFRLDAAAAIVGCRAVVGGLLWWRLASLIRCQGPDRAPHTAIKTCFDEADADVPAAATGVPAGPERSPCVPVHATRTNERRRVRTRRPARHLTSKLHPYAATFPLPQASRGSRVDQ